MGSESDEVCIEDSDDSLDIKELNDVEFDLPHVTPPSLESVLWDMESEEGSDSASLHSFQSMSAKFRSMLCHRVLQGISTQISSAGERVNAGLPTVITNSVRYVAVGTSHGYVLSFDSEQKLCWCCYDTHSSDEGAISALAFNLDSTRLLVGYERGFISMVNATNGDIIRKLPDAHAPQSAVLHLRFTFLNSLALCGDSSGCVFSLIFNRRLGVRNWDSKCLFSGARGEVCIFEPLVQGHDINFLTNHTLVAMATLSKVIVISIRPRLKVLFSQQLPRISTSLPLISWQLVSVGRTFQPVLAWGRCNELNYTRVVPHAANSKRIRLLPLRNVQLPYTLTAIHWLGTRHLALLDTSENLRLVEVRSQRELEVLELANAGLVYSSAHFKALAVGGGVSEAFALAGERACYNSLSCRGDQLLVLGTKAVHLIKLRTWPERLVYLSDQGRWAEALNLAAEEGSNKENFTSDLIRKYLENLNQNAVDKDSLTAAVNCCVKLNKTDILCNELLEAISSDQSNQHWYYTILTDHISNGALTALSPALVQSLVSYLNDNNLTTILESILLSLDLNCLDLHQVLSICKKRQLYDAWIHITTKTLGDYACPLTEFLTELTPDNHRLGNVMLVYVSSCLAGLGYPNGIIPDKNIARAKHDVLRCLESVHSVTENKKTYPYLRALLQYNTRECLNVVELAFTEVEFSGEMGLLQRQRLVQILMQIVTVPEFSESQVINLACFVVRLVTSNNLTIDESMMSSIIKILTKDEEQPLSLRDHNDKEQAWMDLLQDGKLQHVSPRQLLTLSLNANCYRVAEYLYELRKDYSNILECYLKDPIRKHEAFNYILNYINVEDRVIKDQFVEKFADLVAIDAKQASKVVVEHFLADLDQLNSKIDADPQLDYDFLKGIVSRDVKLPPSLSKAYLELLCRFNNDDVENYVQICSCSLDLALDITKTHQVHTATAVLLERTGRWDEALELLLEHDFVDSGVHLCVRGAEHLDCEGAQKLWLTLLGSSRNKSGSVSLRHLLHAAAPHVPPDQLLNLVSDANFGDVKALLQGMLFDYEHDARMFSTTLKLFSRDLHISLAKSLSQNGRGVSVSSVVCGLCRKSLCPRKDFDVDESITVWGCGHTFHSSCLTMCENDSICPVCRTRASPLTGGHNSTNAGCRDEPSQRRPDLEGIF